jgi:hypothetical protein
MGNAFKKGIRNYHFKVVHVVAEILTLQTLKLLEIENQWS